MGEIISFTSLKANARNIVVEKTCRNSCVFFDQKENSCPFFKLDYNDPKTPTRCLEYFDREECESEKIMDYHEEGTWELLEEGCTVEGDENFLFEIIGQSESEESSYPYEPEVPLDLQSPQLTWYVSPDGKFGCWLWNNSQHQLMPVNPNVSVDVIKKGWSEKVYRSPIPLHAPNASEGVRSRMVWYIDEDGYGQYVLFMSNEIKMLSYPKPEWWS